MANVHTPERQKPSETRQQYRERQARSRAIVKTMRNGPTQAPHVQLPAGPPPNWVLWWTGQHTNDARAARRTAIKAVGGIRQFKKQQRAGA